MLKFLFSAVLIVSFSTTTLFAQTSPGAKQAADSAGKKSGSAGAMNAAIGAALLAAGAACVATCSSKPPGPCCPAGPPLLQMGGQAMMQSAADSKEKGAAGKTSFDASSLGNYGFNDETDSINDPTSDSGLGGGGGAGSGLTSGQLRKINDMLKKQGYALDDKGNLNGPNGSIPAGAAGTAAGMASMGLDKANADFVKDTLDKAIKAAEQKYSSSSVAADGGGGGGGRGNSKSDKFEMPDLFGLKDNKNSLMDQLNKKGSVEGMSRSLAGDRIGVAGDDIFNMISRRYQTKSRANFFLP